MRRSARQALWAVVALTLPTWALLWHAEPLLLLFGQEPAIAALAADYLRAFMWGMPCFGAFVVLRGFLAGLAEHVEEGGEGWLILSDLAEHLGLRSRAELLGWIEAAGLRVLGREDIRPRHGKEHAQVVPVHSISFHAFSHSGARGFCSRVTCGC